MKFYAVVKGRNTGVFDTWERCQEEIKGVSGAKFKSFGNYEEAEKYVEEYKNNKTEDGFKHHTSIFDKKEENKISPIIGSNVYHFDTVIDMLCGQGMYDFSNSIILIGDVRLNKLGSIN